MFVNRLAQGWLQLGVCLLVGSGLAWAQTDPLDVCLDGRGSAAINACNATLAAGLDDRDIFLAFGQHLERANRLADAIRLYREALSRYPADKQLKRRLKLAESNLAEQRFIERRKDASAAWPSAEAEAMFKVNVVRCRTLTGKAAIKACEEALSMQPGDAELRRRLATLAPPPLPPVTLPTPPPPPPAPPPVEATREPPAVVNRPNPKQKKQRAWTANIQRQLTRLGYDPGPIDGLPGARTRNAIRELANQPGIELPTTELGEALLGALDRVVSQEARAVAHLESAEQQLGAGRAEGAEAALEQALAQAPWSRVVVSRKATIEQGIDRLLAERRLAQDRAAAERRQRAIADFERQVEGARRRGDLAGAAQTLERAIGQYPRAESLLTLQREVVEAQALRRQEEADRQAREQALAEQRRQEELAKAAAQRAKSERLMAVARQAKEGGDFAVALDLLNQARELAENPEPLARLEEEILGAQLLAEAREAFSRAQQLQRSGADPEPRLTALNLAYEKVTRAMEKRPGSSTVSELRDHVVAHRREVLAEAQALERQRRRLAAAKAALREQIAQLAKVEAELAARELDARREAQRVLEKLWP